MAQLRNKIYKILTDIWLKEDLRKNYKNEINTDLLRGIYVFVALIHQHIRDG